MNKSIRQILVILASLLVISGAGCTSKAKRAYHEHRADKYFAAGDFDKAEIEYINVLRNDNASFKAYSRLGTIYFQQGRFQTAGPFLYKAVALQTNDLDMRLKLGTIYLNFGRFKDAQQSALYILSKDPKFPEAPEMLANMALTQTNINDMRARLQAIARNGDTADIEVAFGTLAFHEHDFPTALADYKRALSMDPKSAAAFEALGTLQAVQDDVANASASLKAAADASPPRSPRRMLYALYRLRNNDLPGAHQVLDDVTKQAPDYLPAMLGLAEISLAQTNTDGALEYLTKALARDPDNFDALMFQGRLDLALRQIDKAIADLDRMTKLFPQAPRVYYQLGVAYLGSGDNTKSAGAFTHALALDPNFTDAQLLLADVQIRARNPDPVIVSMSSLAQQQPQLEQAQLLLADAYRLRDRAPDALRTYLSLEKSFPHDPNLPILTGSTYLQLNQLPEAHEAFERARQIVPDSFPALEALVNIDIAQGNPAAAMQRVQGDLQKDPSSIPLQLLIAKVQLAENKGPDAEATLIKAGQMNSTNPEPDLLLAQLYFNTGHRDQAQASLDASLKKSPQNISAFMLGAAMDEQVKEYEKAADYYEKILAINPQFSPAMNNLAYLYGEYLNKLDRAYELAQNARTLLPFDPSTADTLGWICFKRGSYAAALGLLQESVAKLPAQPDIQYHYGVANYFTENEAAARTAFQTALLSTNQFSGRAECQLCLDILNINPASAGPDVRAKLEKRIADRPDDPIALGRLAAIYQHAGDNDKAVAAYENVLKADPKNLTAMLNLAILYGAKDPSKGLDMAKSANSLAPDNSQVSAVLGWLAYQAGDFKLAATQLQLAVKAQSDDPQVQYEYALAAYNTGDTADAQTAAQNALTLNLPASQSAGAKQLIDMITLAGNPAQAVAASQRIDGILKANPNYAPALLVQAVIKLQAPDNAAAADACEKILAQLPDFAPAQRLLAIIYSASPDKASRGYDLAMKARNTYPNDPALAKATAIIIFQQGDYSRAARLLNNCLDASGSDPEVYYYLGAAQTQTKSPQAKSSLQQALKLNLSGPEADNARKLLAGMK